MLASLRARSITVEERYQEAKQIYPDMPDVTKDTSVEANLFSPPSYNHLLPEGRN
uniref:Uncharacterized protein n=1 Tax=Arion vulgaris TaxID=1028688 RepID=A0A0B7AXU1_9EUPU